MARGERAARGGLGNKEIEMSLNYSRKYWVTEKFAVEKMNAALELAAKIVEKANVIDYAPGNGCAERIRALKENI